MRPLAAALLLVALAGAVRVSTVRGLAHDGAIGMLAASGRQAAYYESMPTARWTSAAAWQDRWTPRPEDALRPRTLNEIGVGLGRRDIHPPLYFWTLHAWLSATTHSPRAAAALGLLTLLLSVALVAGLARHAGAAPRSAAAVAALWGLTGAALDAVLEPRPYVAVAGLSAGVVWLMLRYADCPTRGRLLAVAVAGLLALLTHYYLALVGAVAGVWVVAALLRDRPSRAAWLVGAGVAAAAVAAALHPYLLDAMSRTGAGPPSVADVVKRVALVAAAPVRMVLPVGPEVAPPPREMLAVWAVAGFLFGVAGVVWAVRRRLVLSRPLPPPFVIGGATFAAVGVLFVAGVAPLHSMDPRYGLLVSPLLAAGASVWASSGRPRPWLIVLALYTAAAVLAPQRPADRLPPLAGPAPVVVDTSSAGIVIPLVRSLPSETPVWIGAPLPVTVPGDRMTLVSTGAVDVAPPAGWRAVERFQVSGGTAVRLLREGSGNPAR